MEAFMSEALILLFVLYSIYLIMNKPKTTTEKPMPKAKAETKATQPTSTPAAVDGGQNPNITDAESKQISLR
jgi:hypothetical protein